MLCWNRERTGRLFWCLKLAAPDEKELKVQVGSLHEQRMRILLTGSHGLVGSALFPALTASGRKVVRLVRRSPRRGEMEVSWDPATGFIDEAALEGFDAVVHLAGENLASGRWTAERKARIRDSRVLGTRLLCEALAARERPPHALLSASGIGIYGNREAEIMTEESPTGRGFLAEVCQEWEAATKPAVEAGIRVAHLRFAMILSAEGGALGRMLLPFKLGLGGPLGHGRQYWSWIAIDDVVRSIRHVLDKAQLSGALNICSPTPITNREFARSLGRALSRPAMLAAPAFALRLALGEMADEALLSSTRACPGKLLNSDFNFQFPELQTALKHLLSRRKNEPDQTRSSR
jgi:uncharacterized protein